MKVKHKTFIFIVLAILLLAIAWFISMPRNISLFTFEDYTFEYRNDLYSVENTTPSSLDTGIMSAKVALVSPNYTITINLQSHRLPDSNAFTWFGQSEETVKRGGYFSEATALFQNYNSSYIKCRNFDDSANCTIVVQNSDDGLFYPMEMSILGYGSSSLSIQFNQNANYETYFNEIKDAVARILAAKKNG